MFKARKKKTITGNIAVTKRKKHFEKMTGTIYFYNTKLLEIKAFWEKKKDISFLSKLMSRFGKERMLSR